MIRHLLAGNSGKFISFDIFDTLLTRVWFNPRDPFLVMAHALQEAGLIAMPASEWARLRVWAEQRAQRACDPLEVSHDAIYAQLAPRFGWSEKDCARAQTIEIAVENSSVRPIAEMTQALQAHQGTGGDSALISDSYLPSPVIQRMLAGCGIEMADPDVYVSSQSGLRKRTGALFGHVVEQRDLAGQPRSHIGDNKVSDIRRAAEQGFKTVRFSDADPNAYERALYSPAISSRATRSAFAGAARAARLGRHLVDPHEKALWRVGCDVAGPMLFAFVLWTLKSATAKGVDRLYFVARDGQILLKIARQICDALDLPIRCDYLYGSRQGWHLPGLTEIGEFERGWILEQFSRHSLRALLGRVEITPEIIEAACERAGFSKDRWDRQMSFADKPALNRLLSDPEAAEAICDSAARRRAFALDYFEDVGLLEAHNPAIVDIGWQGRLQRSMCRMIETRQPDFHTRLQGYYLGLSTHASFEEAGRFASFFRADAHDVMGADYYGIWGLVEVFTTADHGALRAFEPDANGRGQPDLLDHGFDEALDWGVMVQQDAIEAFSRDFLSAAKLANIDLFKSTDGLRMASLKAFERMAERPAKDEAEAFGEYPEFGDQQHVNRISLASEVPPALLPLFLLAPEAFLKQGVWRPGIAVRSSPPWLAGLSAHLLRWRRIIIAPTGLRPLASICAKQLLAWKRQLFAARSR
jgi:FMN phosphatase YigB (HAD superfamily)